MLRWFMGILVVLSAGAVAAWWWLERPFVIRHPNFGTDCVRLVDDANLASKVDCVRVWYGTNRVLTTSDPALTSDTIDVIEALPESSNKLNVGRADIWLPKLVEAGGSRERGETPHIQGAPPQDANKLADYVFLTRITSNGRETFTTTLQNAIDDDAKDAVLLFVHGFNVEFDEALVRTAQLSNDLSRSDEFNVGVPVLFSWPSAGSLSLEDYRGDRDRSLEAAPYLEQFLDLLTEDLEVERINIIAHSMGNRVLTQALEDYAKDYLQRHNRDDLEFRILLVAADVERDIFDAANGVFDNLDANITIYTSDTDRALHVSTFVNEERLKRLGDTDKNRPYIRPSQNYQTIDATAVTTELFGIGHNYYSDNPTILWDMMCTIGETAPQERALEIARFGDQPDGAQYYRINTGLVPAANECRLRRTAFPAASAADAPAPVAAPPMEPRARSLPAPVPEESMELPPAEPVIIMPEPMLEPQSVAMQTVLYVEDYDDLDLTRYEATLSQIVDDPRSIEQITVHAFSDTVGRDAENLARTERLAIAIRDWLIARGVAAEAVEATGFGESRLVIETADEIDEPLNRRVEIAVTYAG